MAKVRKTEDQPEAGEPQVIVRITKMGDGKVSNGVHHAVLGDEFYEKDELPVLAESVALDLEARGFAEVQDA